MRNLREEMILKVRFVRIRHGCNVRRQSRWAKLDELRNRNIVLESGESARWQVQLLYEDRLVHDGVPEGAGFHVTFPLVKVDVPAVSVSIEAWKAESKAYFVSMDKQQAAARLSIAHESMGRMIYA